jgi:hypothetical protein
MFFVYIVGKQSQRQVGGAIAQLVGPLTVTPEVQSSLLGIFQKHFQCSHLPRGILVRNPGNPRMQQCYHWACKRTKEPIQ